MTASLTRLTGRLAMRWNICLSWCFLLCFGFGFGRPAPIQQKTKRFCDPAFANQTACAVTWVTQHSVSFS